MTLTKPQKIDNNAYAYYLNSEFVWWNARVGQRFTCYDRGWRFVVTSICNRERFPTVRTNCPPGPPRYFILPTWNETK